MIAILLDEAMGKLNLPSGVVAMTRNREVVYLRPLPIGSISTSTTLRLDLRRAVIPAIRRPSSVIAPIIGM